MTLGGPQRGVGVRHVEGVHLWLKKKKRKEKVVHAFVFVQDAKSVRLSHHTGNSTSFIFCRMRRHILTLSVSISSCSVVFLPFVTRRMYHDDHTVNSSFPARL